MIAAAAGVFLVANMLDKEMSIAEALRQVANHTLLLAAVALAVSVGLVVRALARQELVVTTGAALILAGWAYARFVVGYAALAHWPANPVLYATLMSTATYVMLAIANRMWTPEKLIACARLRS